MNPFFLLNTWKNESKKKHTKKIKGLIMYKNHLWKNTKSTMEKHDY
jgi:hypothetical protein